MNNISRTLQLLLLGGTVVAKMSAIGACSNSYLQGSYGAQMSGVTTSSLGSGVGGDSRVGTASLAGPVTNSARYTFDGAGNVAGYAFANAGGVLLRNATAGTYSVNDDCSVSITLTDSAGSVQNFEGVTAARGDKILLIQTDSGAGLSGVLLRSRNFCSTADFSGTYGYQRQGSNPFFTSVGVVNSDGNGNFTMTQLLYSSSTFSRSSNFGTYVVGDDCSLTLTLGQTSAGDSTLNIRGQLVSNGTEVMAIRTDPGSTIIGNFTSQ